MRRSSGVLMHITSLPNEYGIGTLGKCAHDFADYVRECGCSYWQVLPLNPTGFGDSPYQCFSTFAGNPLLIDPGKLAELGLLESCEIPRGRRGTVDFGRQYRETFRLLRLAHERSRFLAEEIQRFSDANWADWLGDYALFMSLKDEYGTCWLDWPKPLRDRDDPQMFVAAEQHMRDVDFWVFVQYLFFRQFGELREHLNRVGLKLIGDMPIYVAMDSADTWQNRGLFQFRGAKPTAVAGVPPDYFSADGQLWGNPLYRWSAHRRQKFDWWKKRASHLAGMFDAVRMDHFRGFESYWSVPFGAETARDGHWEKGPGSALVETLKTTGTEWIAEDLGIITDAVRSIRDEAGLPGMNILEFAFDSNARDSVYLPHNHQKNSVSYVGTHDNDTLAGWFSGQNEADRVYIRDYIGAGKLNERMLRTLFASPSDLVIASTQDVLGLAKGRMNTPSTSVGNWSFRLRDDSYRTKTSLLKELNRTYSR